MNIERLRVFLAVYECSSMTAAAARLGITQPAVSQSVRELEDEVGAELFVRGRKGITPTRQADRFWEAARRAVRAFEAAENEARRLQQPSRATLRIGATSAPAMSLVPRAMASFAALQEDVLPSLRVHEAETIAASLRVDGYDVGIIDFDASKLDARHFETQFLCDDPLVLVESTQAPEGILSAGFVDASALLTLRPIIPPLGSLARARLHAALERGGIDGSAISPSMEIASAPALLGAVESGSGVAFISHLAALDAERRGAVRIAHVRGVELSTPITAVRSRETVQSEVVEAFWTHLCALRYLSPAQSALFHGDDAPTSSRVG